MRKYYDIYKQWEWEGDLRHWKNLKSKRSGGEATPLMKLSAAVEAVCRLAR